MKLSCEFTFDAAHRLPHYEDGHPNMRLHGHSFRARVSVQGQPNAQGQIIALEDLQARLADLRARLDHTMLNDIEGLESPTLEVICQWLWRALHKDVPQLASVEVFRDSLGQSCLYEGAHDEQ